MAIQEREHRSMSAEAEPAMPPEPAAAPDGGWLDTGVASRTPAVAADNQVELQYPGTDEVFRGIYTRAALGFAPEVIGVCSAISGEGKTTVGLGLAVTLAQDFPDKRIVLVETEQDRPVLADDFAVEAAPGLLECIVDDEPVQNALRPTFLNNLHVMPVGGPLQRPGRPLRSPRVAAVVDQLRQSYDVVILDLPALLVNSDAVLLMDLADGAVWVVRSGVTPMALVHKALDQVDDSKVRGVVLNGTASATPGWLRRLCGI